MQNNKIVFLGDSLTEWGNWSVLLPEFQILNYGIAGEQTWQMLDRIRDVVGKQPVALFLMGGINDLGASRPLNLILDDYKTICKAIRIFSPSTKIFIQSVLPVNKFLWENDLLNIESICELNKAFNEYAQENKHTYIDLFSNFINRHGMLHEKYTVDGLHLNEEGYQLWSIILLKYLKFV